jgi:hypothetical protein
MECSRTETTRILEVLEQLVVNETKCPVRRKWGIHNFKIGTKGHIETNLEFRRTIFVGYNCSGKYFNLRDENLAGLKNTVFCTRNKID